MSSFYKKKNIKYVISREERKMFFGEYKYLINTRAFTGYKIFYFLSHKYFYTSLSDVQSVFQILSNTHNISHSISIDRLSIILQNVYNSKYNHL